MKILKESGIYAIEHTASGKRYVGSAQNLDRRLKKHIYHLNKGTHHSIKLQAAWNKYGVDAFVLVVILKCPIHELLAREQEELDILDTVECGYNISKFADAPMRGRKMSEATRQKMRESQANREPLTEEMRQNFRNAAVLREQERRDTGYIVSEEARVKISKANKGRIVSEETRGKISIANAGNKMTDEQLLKMAKARIGRRLSPEHRAAIGNAHLGKKRSEEMRQKMSVIAKSRSEETRKKLSEALKGKVPSEATRQKMRESRLKFLERSAQKEV